MGMDRARRRSRRPRRLEKKGISVEVFDPRTLQPLDLERLVASEEDEPRRRRPRGGYAHGLRRRDGAASACEADVDGIFLVVARDVHVGALRLQPPHQLEHRALELEAGEARSPAASMAVATSETGSAGTTRPTASISLPPSRSISAKRWASVERAEIDAALADVLPQRQRRPKLTQA